MQSIDSIETCAYWTSKDLVNEKEVIKCNNVTAFTEYSNYIDDIYENIQ